MEKQTNVLLVKTGVGQSKPATHDLPSQGHIYGKKNIADKFNAGSLVSSWNDHTQTVVENQIQDYRKVNKLALKNKVTDAKGLKDFRKDHDFKKVERYETRPIGNRDIKNELATKSFGKPNRPSTPIKGVICGTYGDEQTQLFEEKLLQRRKLVSSNCRVTVQEKSKSVVKTRVTKAHTLATEAAKKKLIPDERDSLDNFKLKRFTQVPSKVVTKRDIALIKSQEAK